jgi:hypothetical protein
MARCKLNSNRRLALVWHSALMPTANQHFQQPTRRQDAMSELIDVLMRRDDLSRTEAIQQIKDAREAIIDAFEQGESAEETFMDLLGLEPDYMLELF